VAHAAQAMTSVLDLFVSPFSLYDKGKSCNDEGDRNNDY